MARTSEANEKFNAVLDGLEKDIVGCVSPCALPPLS